MAGRPVSLFTATVSHEETTYSDNVHEQHTHTRPYRELPSRLEQEMHETVPAALKGHARRSSFTPLKKELGISYHNGDYKVRASTTHSLARACAPLTGWRTNR